MQEFPGIKKIIMSLEDREVRKNCRGVGQKEKSWERGETLCFGRRKSTQFVRLRSLVLL
jgi:DNA relaxase NicK